MDPNSQNPQGESDSVKKLEQDLDTLTQKAKAEQVPGAVSAPVAASPVVSAEPVKPTEPIAPLMVAPVIPEVTPPKPTPVAPPPETPKRGSPLMIVAIILALLAVLAVVVYVFGSKLLTPKSVSTPTPIAVVTPSPTTDPTANWEIYTNNYWGFSIKYPQDKLTQCPNYTTDQGGIRFFNFGFSCPNGTDVVYKIGIVGNVPASQYKEPKEPTTTEQISIDGKQATKNTYIYTESDATLFAQKESQEIVINLNKGILVLEQWGDNTDDKQMFDQILSTFKFVEVTPSATATP